MNGCIDAVNILVNEYICDVNHVSGMDCANGLCMLVDMDTKRLLNYCGQHHILLHN